MDLPELSFDTVAFADLALGAGLGAEVEALIAEAGRLRARPREALALLERARAQAPAHPAPVIALYRFHFYGHELERARAAGEDALALARSALGPAFFGECAGGPAPDEAARHDAAVRFYLFALKGLAYLNLRLGDLSRAASLLDELRGLDPRDRVGGALLRHVLDRHQARQEDGLGVEDAEDAPSAYPAYGWAAARE